MGGDETLTLARLSAPVDDVTFWKPLLGRNTSSGQAFGRGIGGRVNEFVIGRGPDDSLAVSSGIRYRRMPTDVGQAVFCDGERSKTVRAVAGKNFMTGSRSFAVAGCCTGKAGYSVLPDTTPGISKRLWGVLPPKCRCRESGWRGRTHPGRSSASANSDAGGDASLAYPLAKTMRLPRSSCCLISSMLR